MKNKIINQFVLIRRLLSTTILFFGVLFFSPSQSAESSIGDVHNPYYIGLGLGTSFLKPETSSALIVTDHNNDLAYRIFAGYQIDEHWSAELFWSELGKSEIRSQSTGNVVGFIDYQTFGAGALYKHRLDESWQVFVSAGIGLLQNEIQFVNAEGSDEGYVYAGAGIAWNVAETWGLRVEYDFYKAEAQLLSINIVKHFGFGKSRRVRMLEKELQQKDEALHEADVKLSAVPYMVVKKHKTCEYFQIDFERVVFGAGLIELNAKARLNLDKLAKKLLTFPEDITFEIRAHTDDTGSEEYNYRLSLARGREVRDYLSKYGIALTRMDVHGYGEWSQKQGESEVSSRALSRRAEIQLVGIEKYVEDTSSCYNEVSSY